MSGTLLTLLKFVLVAFLVVVGVVFLVNGFGASVPFLHSQWIDAHNVPSGFIVIGLGIVLAVFWRPKISIKKGADTRTIKRPDGTEEIFQTGSSSVTIEPNQGGPDM